MMITLPARGDRPAARYELQLAPGEHAEAGMEALRAGNEELAIEHLAQASAERPNDLETRFALGLLYERQRRYREAVRIFSELRQESSQPRFEEAARRAQGDVPPGAGTEVPEIRDVMAGGVPVSVHVSPDAIGGGRTSNVTVSLEDEFHGDVEIHYLVLDPGVNLDEVLTGPRFVPCAGREVEFEVRGVSGVPFPCDVAIGVTAGNSSVAPENGATITVSP
jgi:tetratricopeptide (TPR) repeat protein